MQLLPQHSGLPPPPTLLAQRAAWRVRRGVCIDAAAGGLGRAGCFGDRRACVVFDECMCSGNVDAQYSALVGVWSFICNGLNHVWLLPPVHQGGGAINHKRRQKPRRWPGVVWGGGVGVFNQVQSSSTSISVHWSCRRLVSDLHLHLLPGGGTKGTGGGM